MSPLAELGGKGTVLAYIACAEIAINLQQSLLGVCFVQRFLQVGAHSEEQVGCALYTSRWCSCSQCQVALPCVSSIIEGIYKVNEEV